MKKKKKGGGNVRVGDKCLFGLEEGWNEGMGRGLLWEIV